jgi:hypothetical protein
MHFRTVSPPPGLHSIENERFTVTLQPIDNNPLQKQLSLFTFHICTGLQHCALRNSISGRTRCFVNLLSGKYLEAPGAVPPECLRGR